MKNSIVKLYDRISLNRDFPVRSPSAGIGELGLFAWDKTLSFSRLTIG